MKRDLEQLSHGTYDVLVIGAGIAGACIAWDAAQRGLRVALIDKGDFGGATSANSMKTVHGGLRYLQDANFPLVRKMIHERKAMMQIAPHLVHPLAFMMPTTHKLMKSKLVMRVAMKLNDIISFDRNQTGDPQKELPDGHVISRAECLELMPGMDPNKITGGVVWYDAQMYNSDRMLLSFIHSAVEVGAHVANYVQAEGFLRDGRRVVGAKVRDALNGESFEIHSRLVINAAGGWTDQLLKSVEGIASKTRFNLSVAINLITPQIYSDYAVASTSDYTYEDKMGVMRHQSNMLLIVPWRKYSIVGTFHRPYNGQPDDFVLTDEDIVHYLNEVNTAHPGANLKPDDVLWHHQGFVPMEEGSKPESMDLVREDTIHDHITEDGVDGLVSVVCVKYTTARALAEKVVNLALEKLQRPRISCRTDVTPIHGGHIKQFFSYLSRQIADAPYDLKISVLEHLVHNYGSEYRQVLKYVAENPGWRELLDGTTDMIAAEVVHSVRAEMALKLTDVILRRTELGTGGYPGDEAVEAVAEIMRKELAWTYDRMHQEIAECKQIFKQTDVKELTVAV
ncbi:MAG: glycerol-3-phosphate dehydrogenase/oxidase [Anaerolineae bacterium]|nr:glycerol-3-phosphate dehydrogenase/oxidase [Anaerolineae bacterium]